MAGGIDGETAPAAGGGETAPATSADQTTAAKPPVAKKAEVGVGRKGQGYGSDPITAPIRARFRIADKLVFDQVTQAMNVYKAVHEHFPRTHNEFMKGIIEANNLSLPELPPGEKYEYDPKTSELMVVPDR